MGSFIPGPQTPGGAGAVTMLDVLGTSLVPIDITLGPAVESFTVADGFEVGDVYLFRGFYFMTTAVGESFVITSSVDGAGVVSQTTVGYSGGIGYRLSVEIQIFVNQNGANYELPTFVGYGNQLVNGSGLPANTVSPVRVGNNTSAPIAGLSASKSIDVEMSMVGGSVTRQFAYLQRIR